MPVGKKIQQEGMRWAVREQLGPLSAEEQAELRVWLEADPRHRGGYVRAQAIRVTVERLGGLTGGLTPLRPAKWARLGQLLSHWLASQPRLLAASIVACVLLALIGWHAHRADSDRYVSGIGELRRVSLDDGSSILLSTATEAIVRLDKNSREVDLSRGEALFEVAKDPVRPFLVHAGDFTIRAIGTAFSVRRQKREIDVTVTEGVVELTREDERIVRVSANQQAKVADAQVVALQALTVAEAERRLAWRTGNLEFDGQTLRTAVDEINRHNRRQIQVADSRLAAQPIVGVFRSIDPEAFARIAATALDAQVIDEGTLIRIEPKAVP